MTHFTEGVDDMGKAKLWPAPSGGHVEPRLQGRQQTQESCWGY